MALSGGAASAAGELKWEQVQAVFDGGPGTFIKLSGGAGPFHFFASCSANSGSKIKANLHLDTAGLPVGRRVQVQFQSGRYASSKFAKVVEGLVVDKKVTLEIDMADPFWGNMLQKRFMTFNIPGRKISTINLASGVQALRGFYGQCRRFLAAAEAKADPRPTAPIAPLPQATLRPTVPNAPLRQAASGSKRPCSLFGQIKSPGNPTRVTVSFVNRTNEFRGILWLNQNGHPVTMSDVAAGAARQLNSFAGHAFMITDGPGNCTEIHVLTGTTSRIELTAPSTVGRE